MKAKKTFKFAVVAVFIAMIFIVGANTPDLFKAIWKYATEVDKGYMWIVNIVIGAIVAVIVAQGRSKTAKFLAMISFLIAVLLSECIIWHRSEITAILMSATDQEEKWVYVGIGVLASIIAYLIVEKDTGTE